jgi:hypothetical protein
MGCLIKRNILLMLNGGENGVTILVLRWVLLKELPHLILLTQKEDLIV